MDQLIAFELFRVVLLSETEANITLQHVIISLLTASIFPTIEYCNEFRF